MHSNYTDQINAAWKTATRRGGATTSCCRTTRVVAVRAVVASDASRSWTGVMRKIVFAVVLLLAAPAMAQDYKFGYICAADEDPLELSFCECLRVSMLERSDIKSKSDLDKTFWGMLVIPIQHPNGEAVSASISVQYISRSCSPLIISVYHSVVYVDKKDLNPAHFKKFSDSIMSEIHPWREAMMDEIQRVCTGNRWLTAGGTDDF